MISQVHNCWLIRSDLISQHIKLSGCIFQSQKEKRSKWMFHKEFLAENWLPIALSKYNKQINVCCTNLNCSWQPIVWKIKCDDVFGGLTIGQAPTNPKAHVHGYNSGNSLRKYPVELSSLRRSAIDASSARVMLNPSKQKTATVQPWKWMGLVHCRISLVFQLIFQPISKNICWFLAWWNHSFGGKCNKAARILLCRQFLGIST